MTHISALTGAFFFCVLYSFEHMSDKTYACFNTLTITGRVSHAEVVEGKYGEFLAVTLLTELKDDATAIAVQFNNTNGLLALAKKGFLNNGRLVTVTGHLEAFTELYFDKKAGKTKRLARPRLTLGQAVVMPGGLGVGPKKETVVTDDDLDIDEAPALPKKQAVASSTALKADSDEISF